MSPSHVRATGAFAVFFLFVFTTVACGPKKTGGGNFNDASIVCNEDDECPGGMLCIGNICQTPEDGGTDVAVTTAPDISVDPVALDFGFAPLRVDTTLPLAVTNNGDANLEITAILVEEVDALQEYHSSPEGVQNPPLIVAPGATVVINVTLRPEDGQLDNGQLRINSNDPDEGSITIPLTSGYKGLPDLDPCVLDATEIDPEPFVDCATTGITNDPIIDFGVVQFQQDASRLVVVRNTADGNAPLTIDSIEVSNLTGLGGHFSLEIFWLEDNPGGDPTEIPVTLPVHLRAADPILQVEEDHLYVRIRFDADLDGFLPAEYLVYTSNDADGELSIPIFGVVSGCPSGTWDINNDPNDGCEYLCDYEGPEVCDGVDNNCNGQSDEENALGCTNYYLDVDNDTYGVSGNSRCLCQPDTQTHHTATVGGDCNDARQLVNPGMVEQCATSDDDDCDGDTNDVGAFGCTTFFRDSDNDTYGVSSDTACLCVAQGDYTATTGGDCDDANYNANPGQTEDCLTLYDDNCNNSTNDQNALNCTDFYVDLDQDGYGQTFLSQCLCVGQGNYTATLPNDCNDNNPNVNPSVQEDCFTSFDDNCNQDTNEQNAVNCTNYYFDADNDGHGLTNDYQCRCAPLGNYRATVGGDCNDGNPSVSPSALETCATVFDDNCDGDTNDLNASGCNIYYLDQDGDTYGVAGNSQCRCNPQGSYQALVTGDCNDSNVQVHPGMSETCDTAYDDNCDGVTNQLNALNCVSFFWDQDSDGYGTSLSQCRCGPYDFYTASFSGDCQDQNAAINPGAPEICDNIDNNCVNGVDEGFDKQSSINHCGACGNTCTNGHGTTVCVSGVCTPTCAAGWGDCNGDPDDGCETDLTSVGSCGTCNFDSDCPPDFFCSGSGTCAAEKPNGDTCTRDQECTSAHCVDGYCCDTACNGTCEACDISGDEGTCTAHANGLDPDNECSSTGQDTCGQNGSCNGTGDCALWPTGTVCVQQTCTGNTRYLNDTCNGAGTCTDGGTQDCSPYQCNGPVCRTTCSDDSHCVSGSYCSGGACVGKKPNGQICTAGNECQSNSCADGVCCDTPCLGLCRACNLSGSVGTCGNIVPGTDPANECGLCRTCNGTGGCANAVDGTDPKTECTQTAQSTCGDDGQCNGSGGCRDWAFGTECVPQSCTGNTKWLADSCNGAGTCVDGGSVDCSPYLCLGTDCRTSCTLNTHCIGGSWCNAGSCVGQKGLGQSCTGNAECLSNNCVDSVCCNSACTGTCRHCNLTGSVGTCVNIPSNTDPEGECAGSCMSCNGSAACAASTAGTDPENDCAQTAQSTCGDDGQCNGGGGCRDWVSGTQCVAQTCSGSTRYPADTCNGTGTCVDNGSVPCAPYMCNAAGDDCRTDCSLDSHCTAGNYCNSGSCAAKKANGVGCSAATECQSAICVDGVCCNAACSGVCRACNLAGLEGTCTNHAVNTDPEGGCATCRACNGTGSCMDVAVGTDPLDQCSLTGQDTCGYDGDCNGTGACRYWPAGTQCAGAFCSGPSTKTEPDLCNGSGLCQDGGTTVCDPYICTANACRTNCTMNSHCVTGFWCSGGLCQPQKTDGTACGTNGECASGYCTDGVCCNVQCGTQCVACNLSGSVGTCTPQLPNTDPSLECGLCQVCNGSGACASAGAGSDPKGECGWTSPSTCGLDGECNGSGACRQWVFGTECVAQSCSVALKYLPDQCNGAGTCIDGGTQSCAPYACLGDDCRTSCTLQTHCSTGNYCNTGTSACQSKKPNGTSCGTGVECDSGICADGVCCNTTCGGVCEACNIVGKTGTCSQHTAQTDPETECPLCRVCNGAGACTNATDSTDPKGECLQAAPTTCGLDGDCNGSGACGSWASGTVCVAQTCSAHIQYDTDTCNGSGTCTDGGTTNCTPYECDGSSCRTNCGSDAHCVAGYYCNGAACVSKLTNGTGCSTANQCQSGFCTDGVCCNSGCAGDCRACNKSGFVGTCTNHSLNTDPESDCSLCQACNGTGSCANVSGGTDPLGQCANEGAPSCGQNGFCDGLGACGLYAGGTVCVTPVCLGNTLQVADTCNGTGSCVENGINDCSPYMCDGGGTSCRTNCTMNSHCVGGYYCNGGACVPENPAGTPCVLDSECASNYCRDGYCCNNDCAGECRSCDRPGVEGTCTLHTTNTDPDDECGNCEYCNGSGACISVPNGSDPLGDCTADAQSTCQYDGNCDGTGVCRYWAAGTICDTQTCVGSTRYPNDLCSGGGVCNDSGSSSCSPYRCNGNACGTTCSGDGDCVAGYYCSGVNCVAKKPLGTACSGPSYGNECQSGNCVDGVCCNTTCGGICQGCANSGSVGTCSSHTSNTDPDHDCTLCRACNGSGACMNALDNSDPKLECSGSVATTCGLDGDCNGSGVCGYWPPSQQCSPQTCGGAQNNTLYPADYCSGGGACVDSGGTPCPGSLQCNATNTACRSTCSLDSHCLSGYFCGGGSCQPKKTNGTACTGPTYGNECQSGNCVDGVCCNAACGGLCEACNIAGSVGTCTDHAPNTDPEDDCTSGNCHVCNGAGGCMNAVAGTNPELECINEGAASCGMTGVCNASGSCATYPNGTICVDDFCSGSTLNYNHLCSGGTCAEGGSLSCGIYMCDPAGPSCRSTCSINAHCVSGYYCTGTTCCSPVSTDSGTSCGTGTYQSYTNNPTTPVGRDYTGNLVGVTERWYRFQGIEAANNLNVWIWLDSNPSDEFRIAVSTNDTGRGETSTCSSGVESAGCDSTDTHYQWYNQGSQAYAPVGSPQNDSQAFYVRVYRKSGATPSCNNYTVRIRVGGAAPPSGWTAPVYTLCDNSCTWEFDHDCDDGGPGSDYSLCALGTDCGDCGIR